MADQQTAPQGAPSPPPPPPAPPQSARPQTGSVPPPPPSRPDSQPQQPGVTDGSPQKQATSDAPQKRQRAKPDKESIAARKAVDNYLKAMGTIPTGSGEQTRLREKAEKALAKTAEKIADLDAAIEHADGVAKLEKLSKRASVIEADDKNRRLLETMDEMDKLEADFVLHAKRYARDKHIPMSAWLEAGVNRKTLKEAGIV